MIVDYTALAARYSQMTEEDFALIKREELTTEARACYDREMARRTPGWHYEEPGPEVRLPGLIQLQKKLKRQRTVQLVIWMALCLVLLAFYVRAPDVLEPQEASTFRLYLMGSATLLLVFAGLQARVSTYRTGYLILWLRRFHRRRQKPFLRALNNACEFVGMPLTIQDSSFRFSVGFAIGRLLPWIGFFVVIRFFGGLLGGPLVADLASVVGGMVIAVGIGTSYWWAFFSLRGEGSSQRLLRLIEKIRAGRARSGGAMILRAQDEFWRPIVEQALQHADAIIIDVTEPSENVIWELQAASKLRPAGSILLACAIDENTPDNPSPRLPEAIRSELERALGEAQFGRLSIFLYPAGNYGWMEKLFPRFTKAHWSHRLRDALPRCLSYAPAHED